MYEQLYNCQPAAQLFKNYYFSLSLVISAKCLGRRDTGIVTFYRLHYDQAYTLKQAFLVIYVETMII